MKKNMTRMRIYKINDLRLIDHTFLSFWDKMRDELMSKYKYRSTISPVDFCLSNLVWVAVKPSGEIIGLMSCKLTGDHFNYHYKILRQVIFYSKSYRASKILFDEFIDFGKNNADAIITNIAEHTNIKESTLKKLGFSKMETLYKLEK